jgi:hypothetical protein
MRAEESIEVAFAATPSQLSARLAAHGYKASICPKLKGIILSNGNVCILLRNVGAPQQDGEFGVIMPGLRCRFHSLQCRA